MHAAAGRRRTRRNGYVLGAVAAAALLASTGYDAGSDGRAKDRGPSAGPSPAGAPSPTDAPSASAAPSPPGKPGAPSPTGATSSARPTGSAPAQPGGTGGGAVDACAESDLSFSVTNEDAAGEPVRHLLLTVTNRSGRTCTVHRYPSVLVGANAQGPVPVIKDSDPKALASLAPGKQAHAALLVKGGRMDEYAAHELVVRLQGPRAGGPPGKAVTVALPRGVDKVWGDDGGRVTYWTTASGYALDFIMSL
ncbi:DUF4232 domain-containing protein [Streptomyces sp. WAC06614]|uniref:DUF4232 domain-containing protein n=1 Tax=Streptomyces sp. WAC06614 TaxID=2487416 RepID=UPI000FAF6456|nr:DUF4232 domain-containing protein [Streptomyces sp. WAC06614]RSS62881.1 DUF4232 domain-containing protein [Streptomyces sp. WAC06614]